MKKFNLFFWVFLTLFVSACSFLTTDSGSQNTYVLSSIQPKNSQGAKGGLVIAKPLMASGLNSEKIALTHEGIKVDYYASARWGDNLGVMVQDRLTESLHNAHIFKFAVTDKVSLNPSYFLVVDIRAFQAEYGAKDESGKDKAPMAHVAIQAKLLNASNRSVSRQFTASAKKQASENSLAAVAKALDMAFRDVQAQIVEKLR